MKFRKKPVVIEAVRLGWDTWPEICQFVPRPWFQIGVYLDENGQVMPQGQTSKRLGLLMKTLENNEKTGLLLATEGDWIIKGIKGEFYPCKPDIFEATYEEVK